MQNYVSLYKVGVIDQVYDTVNIRIKSGNLWRNMVQAVMYNHEEAYLLGIYFDEDRFNTGLQIHSEQSIPKIMSDDEELYADIESDNYPPFPDEEEPEEDFEEDEDEYR